MRRKLIWTLFVAFAALAAYAGNVLATPPIDAGLQRHDAGEGHLRRARHQRPHDPSRRSGRPSSRRRGIPTSTSSRTLGSQALCRRVHSQQRLAHPSRAEPRDRDARHGDRIRRRRSDLHAARVLGRRDELVRRHRQRRRPHHPRRERRRGEDGRRPAHPEGRHSTDRREPGSRQLPVLRLIRQEGGIAALQPSGPVGLESRSGRRRGPRRIGVPRQSCRSRGRAAGGLDRPRRPRRARGEGTGGTTSRLRNRRPGRRGDHSVLPQPLSLAWLQGSSRRIRAIAGAQACSSPKSASRIEFRSASVSTASLSRTSA